MQISVVLSIYRGVVVNENGFMYFLLGLGLIGFAVLEIIMVSYSVISCIISIICSIFTCVKHDVNYYHGEKCNICCIFTFDAKLVILTADLWVKCNNLVKFWKEIVLVNT